jgi:two-component system, NtrC family, sensor kinase
MQAIQTKLIQSEKMSALGQTVAGIAHEINNPISFIYGNLNYLVEHIQNLFNLIHLYHNYFPFPPSEICLEREKVNISWIEEDISKILRSMNTGTQRIRDVVLALRNFSRLDEVGYKAVDLHEGIDNALMILQPKIAKVQIIKQYGELPRVTCAARDLNQVFMNILNNAIDAIAQKIADGTEQSPYIGMISIQTESHSSQQVMIRIADNGIGIPPEVIDRVFDPFFTMKKIGQGTGLGLAIAYQIITEQHGGKLYCHSLVGKGTEFVIELPICSKPKNLL